jgi:hypothetical protein
MAFGEVGIRRRVGDIHVAFGQSRTLSQTVPPSFVSVDSASNENGPALLSNLAEDEQPLFVIFEIRVDFNALNNFSLVRHHHVSLSPRIPQTPQAIGIANIFFQVLEGEEQFEMGEASVWLWICRSRSEFEVNKGGGRVEWRGFV